MAKILILTIQNEIPNIILFKFSYLLKNNNNKKPTN